MRRHRPEDQIQRAIVQHLKARCTNNVFWYAIPNGGARSKIEAAIMQSTGTRRGVPDLAFVHDGRPYFLEVKTEDGRATEHQLKAIEEINQAGGQACIAYGLDPALACLERWGLLKGTAQ